MSISKEVEYVEKLWREADDMRRKNDEFLIKQKNSDLKFQIIIQSISVVMMANSANSVGMAFNGCME